MGWEEGGGRGGLWTWIKHSLLHVPILSPILRSGVCPPFSVSLEKGSCPGIALIALPSGIGLYLADTFGQNTREVVS